MNTDFDRVVDDVSRRAAQLFADGLTEVLEAKDDRIVRLEMVLADAFNYLDPDMTSTLSQDELLARIRRVLGERG